MIGRGVLAGLLALAALAPIGQRAAHAAGTATVAICDEAHLRSAIGAAGAGGTVTFGCSGTIALAATITLSQDVTIDGTGQQVAVSGGGHVGVLAVGSGVRLTVRSLTITGGSAGTGGGIDNNGTVVVTGSTVSGNAAGAGAGIANFGTLIVSGSAFSANHGAGGGGIYNDRSGTTTVDGSTFSGNTDGAFGGGIFNNGGALAVSNSTFSGNHGNNGAALSSGGAIGSLAVSNSTFSGNSSPNFGGALFTANEAATITNSTFSGNSATAEGGNIYNIAGTVQAVNTIVADSTGGGNCANVLGATLTDGGGNVDDGTSCGFGAGSLSSADPLLAPLANNGGPVAGAPGQPTTGPIQTEALLPGSPAIDAGLAATCIASPVNDVDQRGLPRYAALRGVCDSGAYDTGGGIVPPLTVTGAIPLTTGVPARLGFAASDHGSFPGVALPGFPIGYITFQRGISTFVVRQPVAMACTSAIGGLDHCVGTTGLVNGLPGFIQVPGTAILTLSGTISSAQGGAYRVGQIATVALSLSASSTGAVTVSKIVVAVAGTPVATWAAPLPAGTAIRLDDAAPLIP